MKDELIDDVFDDFKIILMIAMIMATMMCEKFKALLEGSKTSRKARKSSSTFEYFHFYEPESGPDLFVVGMTVLKNPARIR